MILNAEQMKALNEFVSTQMMAAEAARKSRNCYLDSVYRSLHGDIKYEEDVADQRRQDAQNKGLLTALPDQLARFGDAKLRELANDIVNIIMPVDAAYNAVADEESSDKVKNLVAVCRTFALNLGHRSALIDTVYQILAVQHCMVYGEFSGVGDRPTEDDFTGVRFTSIDMYAAFMDGGLPLRRASRGGTIMGFHRKVSPMEILIKEETTEDYTLPPTGNKKRKRTDPTEADQTLFSVTCDIRGCYRDDKSIRSTGNRNSAVNLKDMIGAFGTEDDIAVDGLIETTFYVRLPAKILSIPGVKTLQTYKCECVNGYLVNINPAGPGNMEFPFLASNLYLDRDHNEMRSYGEHAADMNMLLSAVMNLAKRAMRVDAVGGTTFIDGRLMENDFDMSTVTESTRFVKVKVPVSANGEKSLSSYVYNAGGGGKTLSFGDMDAVYKLFGEALFPQSSRADLVNLDRATAMGASLAASSADSTLMTLAIMLDDMIGVPWRRMLKKLILNNTGNIKLVDPKAQEFLSMDLEELNKLEFEFTMSQPVAGFDRNRVMQAVQVVLNMLLQSPQISEDPARVQKILDYFLELASAGTIDLKHFDLSILNEQQGDTPPADTPEDPASIIEG